MLGDRFKPLRIQTAPEDGEVSHRALSPIRKRRTAETLRQSRRAIDNTGLEAQTLLNFDPPESVRICVHLKKESLKWALANVERHGDTDILPVPFEYKAIRSEWGQVLPALETIDVSEHQLGPFRQCLSPKSRYGYRVATQLDPIDQLLFSGLVYEVAKDLDRSRVPKRDHVVVSHRVSRNIDGQLFDPEYNFEKFRAIQNERATQLDSSYIAVTDIADFYPRLYHHPLEHALDATSADTNHVREIKRFLSALTFSTSYGIPVGPSVSRLLAEIALNDIDQALLAEGISFCRFSDDFRIFANTEHEAFSALALLAEYLHENHGLTLSERKTDVLERHRYLERYIDGNRPKESPHISDRVTAILERYRWQLSEDEYAQADPEDLPEEMVAELDELDLNAVLHEQVADRSRIFDHFAVSIALRRLAQLEDGTLIDVVLDNVDFLIPTLPRLVAYLRKVVPVNRRSEVGARLAAKLKNQPSGHRDFEQAWILSLFSEGAEWSASTNLMALRDNVTGDVPRSAMILALGTAGETAWFSSQRRQVLNQSPWDRRAFISASACLPSDNYVHWMKSLQPRLLGLLDTAVAEFSLRGS